MDARTPISAGVRRCAEELRTERTPFVLATVVYVERPTSAKPGDLAVVRLDGSIHGFVGGECAQSSVRAEAVKALHTGEPVLLRITPDAQESPAATVSDRGTVTVRNLCLSGGASEIFLEPVLPPPLLLIHGESPIAQALAEVAERVGYAPRLWLDGSLPDDVAAVVVASHGRDEEDLLRAALAAEVPYVGLVASQRRGAAVLASLELDAGVRDRIHTPAGLDIGARTPAEVALSILAEMVASRPRPTEDPQAGPSPSATATAIDPVCGMSVATLSSSLHIQHDALTYWFCGSGCQKAFTADPVAFLG